MITSKRPWTTKLTSEGYVYVSDALGNKIALFKDPQDADFVVESVSIDHNEILTENQELKEEVAELEKEELPESLKGIFD